jgi:hypothetical protein
MARRVTAAQAKAAKQKKIVIVLAVVFVAVAAIQVPKLMKQLHPKPAGMAAPAPGSVPVPSGASPAGAAATSAAPSQLHSFTSLRLKDPFKPLVTVPVAADSGSGSSPPADATSQAGAKPAASPKPSATPKSKLTSPATEAPASGTVPFSAAQPPPNAAIVKTNGHRQLVYFGDGFPTADPLFRLVSLGAEKTVRVGVLGGSFVDGAPTIKLARGKEVTLANEADGSRYVIELVRLTTAAPKPAKPAAPAAAAGAAAPATATDATSTTDTTTTAATTTNPTSSS